jgi:chromosome segregation ATPase
VSKAILFILAGVLFIAGLAACEAPDQPSQDQQVSMQPTLDAAAVPSQELQQDLQDEMRRSELAEQKVRRMQAEIEALRDQNADLITQELQAVDSAGLDLAACRRELNDIQNRLQQEQDLAVNLRTEQTKLIEESIDRRTKNEVHRDLKAELSAAEQSLTEARDELEQANEQIESLQTELQILEQNYNAMQESAAGVPQLEENVSVLQAEKAILKQSAQQEAELQKQLSDTRRELAAALTKLEEMEARLQSQ